MLMLLSLLEMILTPLFIPINYNFFFFPTPSGDPKNMSNYDIIVVFRDTSKPNLTIEEAELNDYTVVDTSFININGKIITCLNTIKEVHKIFIIQKLSGHITDIIC